MSDSSASPSSGVPGSASAAHPSDGIPLPAHGFASLDASVAELVAVPAAEVVSRAAVLLMGTAAEKLGLTQSEEPDLDLEDARLLITGLAGLLAASRDGLGEHAATLHEGLRTLQGAFREASSHPDAPGAGPGEHLLS